MDNQLLLYCRALVACEVDLAAVDEEGVTGSVHMPSAVRLEHGAVALGDENEVGSRV
jgi:hypothetical protein